MSSLDRARTLVGRAKDQLDESRTTLSYLEQSVDDLSRRRRPVDRLDLDDIAAAIRAADTEAEAAYHAIESGLDELRATQDPGLTAVLSLARQLDALGSELRRLFPPQAPAPRGAK